MADLQLKIEAIRTEIKEWAQLLDAQNPGHEWENLRQLSLEDHDTSIVHQQVDDQDSHIDALCGGLTDRINKLQLHTHLLESSGKALSELSQKKIDILSSDFVSVTNARKVDAKSLLRGLSSSLVE